jgi:hypothetical protein
MRRLLLFTLMICASSACTPMPPNAKPSKPYPPRLAQCQSDPGQRFVGQAASEDLVKQARIATGANTVRVLRPGMAATMDFRDDRLNLHLDEHDVIVQVSCG